MFVLVLACSTAIAGNNSTAGSRVSYIGGTVAEFSQGCAGALDAVDPDYFVFWTNKKANLRIAYDRINLLEYGQKVSRRVGMAVVVSPMFLLTKKRQHFLTLGYQDDNGKQQAMVFRVDKSDIRTVLVTLEARTGLKVQYQDEDARRGGKG